MIRYSWLVIHIVGLLTTTTGAAGQGSPLPPLPIDTFTLANGLHVIVSPDESTPVVAVSMWYGVGSAREREGESGFAHLFEHLVFGDTESLEAGELRRLVTGAGGTLEANTTLDRTAYQEVLPAERLNLALWLHAERMDRLRLSREGVREQSALVASEHQMRLGRQPYALAQRTQDTLSQSYPPYKRTVMGSTAELGSADLSDLQAFHERYYTPRNATLAVVGDVTTAQVRRLAGEMFGAMEPGPELPSLPVPGEVPRTDGERRVELSDSLAGRPLISMGFLIPPARHPDHPALTVLAQILIGADRGRLRRRMSAEGEMAAALAGAGVSRLGPGSLVVVAVPERGHTVEAVEAVILDEVDRLRAGGVTERELQAAKNQLRFREAAARTTVGGRATRLQESHLLYGSAFEANGAHDRLDAVSLEDVLRVARMYLVAANRAMVVVRPRTPTGP